jgi:hypothetical protein
MMPLPLHPYLLDEKKFQTLGQPFTL